MKFFSSAIALTIFGTIIMNLHSSNVSANENIESTTLMRAPKLQKTIDLSDVGSSSVVKKMTFSPDGRYLAIVDNPVHLKTDIIVWDLKLDKKQSHIHCPYDYGDLSDHDLLWSHDGKIISFGAIRQWNPMTGDALPNNPAIGRAARLNKDGNKMLTIVGIIGDPSYIYVYNTSDWSLHKIYVGGFVVTSAAWTAEDKILVGVGMSTEVIGKKFDGRGVVQPEDTALMLLDPAETKPATIAWFPQKPTNDINSPYTYAFPIASRSKTNFVTNQIFLGAGKIIDGTTLNIKSYQAAEENDTAPGAFGMDFSANGQLLILKGAYFRYGGYEAIKNSIIDIASGKILVQFDGALENYGLAVSPDGLHFVLGNGQSVLVFTF